MTEQPRGPSRRQRRWPALLASVAFRVVVFALLWWAVTEGDASTWVYGVVVVPLVVAVSMVVLPHRSRTSRSWRSGWALLTLAGWFLYRSVAGGVDVARRALTRRPDVDPGFVHCPLRLPDGGIRIAAADLMTLMPGSLSVELDSQGLSLHVLDMSLPIPQMVADLEERLAAVARVKLPDQR